MHFLLIEDNQDHAFLIARAFEARSTEIMLTHVDAGDAGLSYLRQEGPFEHAPLPDAVLLDLNLPRLNGIEVLKAIKSDPTLAALPVIVLTTSSAELDRARAYASHANSYLVKPLDFGQLSELVEMICRYWADLNARVPAVALTGAGLPPGASV